MSSIELKGKVIRRWDFKHQKWNNCGVLQTVRGQEYYVTRKREVLHIGGVNGSLGVSQDILEFLFSEARIPRVMFKLGKKKPFQIYITTVSKLLTQGKPYSFGNEQDQTFHLPLERLEGAVGQTVLL